MCNQIVGESAGLQYVNTRRSAQERSMVALSAAVAGINTRRDASVLPPIALTKVPYIESEVTSIYGLRFFSSIAHALVEKGLTATNPMDSRKLTIFGGKGGVGKTTSAASWAVRLADRPIRLELADRPNSLGNPHRWRRPDWGVSCSAGHAPDAQARHPKTCGRLLFGVIS